MELIFLGTGPSEPVQGNGRTRSSIFISSGQTSFMIDCTPDFSEQVQRENIDRIDFMLFTHAHADAVGGIAQLQQWMEKKDMDRMVVFMEKETADQLKLNFESLSHLDIRYFHPYVPFTVNNIKIEPFRVEHSLQEGFPACGFRFLDIVYSEDVGSIPEKSLSYFQKADTIIYDVASWFGDKGHNAEDALKFAQEMKPRNFIMIQPGGSYPAQEEAEHEIRTRWQSMSGGGDTTNIVLAQDGLKYKMHDHVEQMLKELREGMILAYPHGMMI
jgi:phosphoribosyl 1,2-cyclic phosphate phosphodiesterase